MHLLIIIIFFQPDYLKSQYSYEYWKTTGQVVVEEFVVEPEESYDVFANATEEEAVALIQGKQDNQDETGHDEILNEFLTGLKSNEKNNTNMPVIDLENFSLEYITPKTPQPSKAKTISSNFDAPSTSYETPCKKMKIDTSNVVIPKLLREDPLKTLVSSQEQKTKEENIPVTTLYRVEAELPKECCSKSVKTSRFDEVPKINKSAPEKLFNFFGMLQNMEQSNERYLTPLILAQLSEELEEDTKVFFSQYPLLKDEIPNLDWSANPCFKKVLIADSTSEAHQKILIKPQKRGFDLKLLLEIEVLKKSVHPNIVKPDFFFVSHNKVHYTLPLFENSYTLSDLIGKILPPQANSLIVDVLNGLAFLHSHDISLHTLKPSNVVVDKNVAKIANFNNVTMQTFTSWYDGNVFYVPHSDPKSAYNVCKNDIWSVGVIYAELLSGIIHGPFNTLDLQALNYASYNVFQFFFKSNTLPIGNEIVDHKTKKTFALSNDQTDFLNLCFQEDLFSRPSAKDLLTHNALLERNNQIVFYCKHRNLYFVMNDFAQ